MGALRFALRWLTPPWLDRMLARYLERRRADLQAQLDELQDALDALKGRR